MLAAIPLVLFAIFGFASQENASKIPAQEKQVVDEFDKVGIYIPVDVFVHTGKEYLVEINAGDDMLEKIELKVENQKLYIKKKDGAGRISGDIRIDITAPVYHELSLSGSGDLYAQEAMKTDELSLKIAGSGDMKFDDLLAGTVNVKIAGSGDIVLKGKGSDELIIAIAGSGDFNSKEFVSNDIEIKISGSGDCVVNAKEALAVSIAGSGSVKYMGSPSTNTTVSGSGSVTAL